MLQQPKDIQIFKDGERLIIVTRRYEKREWDRKTNTTIVYEACDAIWIEPPYAPNQPLGRSLVSGMHWDEVKDLPQVRLEFAPSVE